MNTNETIVIHLYRVWNPKNANDTYLKDSVCSFYTHDYYN